MKQQTAAELFKEAEKKAKSWNFSLFGFGNGSSAKWEHAGDLYVRAGNLFKAEKKVREAADSFLAAADCDLRNGSKGDAASNLQLAANVLRDEHPQEAVDCFNRAVQLFVSDGRFYTAANAARAAGEILQKDNQHGASRAFFQKAADYFAGENSDRLAQSCLVKVAQLSAVLREYAQAGILFEKMACESLDNTLTRFNAPQYFLCSGLAFLAFDPIAAHKAVDRFATADPGFSQTREYELLRELLTCVDKRDPDQFSSVLFEYDKVSKLDAWKTNLLLEIKKSGIGASPSTPSALLIPVATTSTSCETDVDKGKTEKDEKEEQQKLNENEGLG